MNVIVLSESDYDYHTIYGVFRSIDKAMEYVTRRHKQTTLKVEATDNHIIARYRGGASYYDIERFEMSDGEQGEESA